MQGDKREHFYKSKPITFLNRDVAIVTQNENGPCPLLAIANVLLLRNAIKMRSSQEVISSHELIATLATRILDSNVSERTGEVFKGFDVTETSRERLYENNEQNVETALSVLPSLVSGLDVNVKFIDSRAFEFTGNLCVFDALDVSLYHGWVVDARFDYTTGHVVSRLSYNQLVERLIELRELEIEHKNIEEDKLKIEEEMKSLKSEVSPATKELNKELDKLSDMMEGGRYSNLPRSLSNTSENSISNSVAMMTSKKTLTKQYSNNNNFSKIVLERAAIEEFLDSTPTQCTEDGLKSVFGAMRNNELGVFFRNNHFSVIFKRDNQFLLSLVTDEGFIDEKNIVWEIVYDDDAIDETDIDYAEEKDDNMFAHELREQRRRERDQVFLNADFKPFNHVDNFVADVDKISFASFSPRDGDAFPSSPAKAFEGTPYHSAVATTTSSDDDFEIARKLHSELNKNARFEAPSVPATHHTHAQFVPPANTYEGSIHDADLAYAMSLQQQEEDALAALEAERLNDQRHPFGHRGRMAETTTIDDGTAGPNAMYTTHNNNNNNTERSAYLRPVQKIKSSKKSNSSSAGAGAKTSENCVIM